MKCFLNMLFLATFILSFAACTKILKQSASLKGEWELVRVAGSRPVITYPKGNGNMVKFTDSTYQFLQENRVVKGGDYKVIEDTTVEASVCLVLAPGKYQNRIIYDNDVAKPKTFIQISNDTLSVISGCFAVDAGSNMEYVRQK